MTEPEMENFSIIKVRVLYADTDQMGVVYHSNYLKWFEAGRGTFMRRRGLSYTEVEKSGLIFPVVEVHARYRKPALYDQVIEIKCWVADVKRAQLRFEYSIEFEKDVLVTGFTRHGVLNKKGIITLLPDNVRQALLSCEQTNGEKTCQ